MWRSHKYATVYHVLNANPSPELTHVDYGWAARALSLHIDDAAWLIGDHNLSEIERIVQSAERVRDKIQKEQGRVMTTRDLIRGVSAIKNVAMAEGVMRLMRDGHE